MDPTTASELAVPQVGDAAAERIAYLVAESRSPATRRAYRSDWLGFQRWCDLRGHRSRPADPTVVAAYLAEVSQLARADGSPAYAPSTLARWVAGINYAHEIAGLAPPGSAPIVTATLSGIRRDRRWPVRRSRAITLDVLRSVLAAIDIATWPAAVTGHRDRLVLLLGFATAMRRSELADLLVGDVTDAGDEGIRIRLRHSKTDQEGAGAWRPVPPAAAPQECPVCAWVIWRRLCGPGPAPLQRAQMMRQILTREPTGHVCRQVRNPYLNGAGVAGDEPIRGQVAFQPLLRTCRSNGVIDDRPMSGSAIYAVVKRRVATAGLDPDRFGAHSLRAGFVTQALRGGAGFSEVMRQTGHHSAQMVQIYAREHDPLRGNAVTKLGL